MGAGTSGFRVGLSVMTSKFPYRDSLLFRRGQLSFFLSNCCFPESLHTQGLHKFVGSISGVVSMNTACIIVMILD